MWEEVSISGAATDFDFSAIGLYQDSPPNLTRRSRSFAAKNAAQEDKGVEGRGLAYCVNSAGRPVRRSMRLAIGGCVENRLPKFIPING